MLTTNSIAIMPSPSSTVCDVSDGTADVTAAMPVAIETATFST